ncbi:NUDIX hydrolase [Cryobacterium sp. TMT1-21]|uniref:NUDIX hydrolase n=1 Tax=Cryobacterium shii TaxID=1259235 RepID=A0AAQ2C4A7_9MICO|nr:MULTISPECIES: NUDIX domain-containing protein [Cryobacterium]TFC42795.1 NUDIX hydrolase [Cryobacterium shii]TFC89002.1 NUDIX hydrolase [Cryobacterium sp. TmT2-59]TFD11594.1 NUDIX hydrolase [Cryobacterium sp. TMT4-10]TFD14730.1 NUDIX hydrolase [Cryobacterium sp. TMT1-21]TFD22317.1 NUDIX hydrolase [Cryobacterium sp. TMT2-23]
MTDPVYAAGAVCWRLIDGKMNVLLIHRTVYGDVTIPKGKLDPGETLPQTAVREIEEETGLAVALGVPLGISAYSLLNGREKIVHYWAAEVSPEAIQQSTFVPNGEVAAIEWVTIKKARTYLSYTPDVDIIDAFAKLVDTGVTRTFALIALRHAKAVQPGNWDGTDSSRPLTERGVKQATAIVPTITAWQPRRIVSSTATRCVTTVAPLAAATGIPVKRTERYSQDAFEQGTADVRSGIGKRVRSRKTAVICSHGPVLPKILHEIALATGSTYGSYISDAAALETGSFSVVHLSADNPSAGIVAIETHSPAV